MSYTVLLLPNVLNSLRYFLNGHLKGKVVYNFTWYFRFMKIRNIVLLVAHLNDLRHCFILVLRKFQMCRWLLGILHPIQYRLLINVVRYQMSLRPF